MDKIHVVGGFFFLLEHIVHLIHNFHVTSILIGSHEYTHKSKPLKMGYY